MFTVDQFVRIASMQDSMNVIAAGSNWKEQPLGWGTAVFAEAAECIGHIGWEWWKKTTPDTEQAKMEIVDMLHFAVSGAIVNTPAALIVASIEQNLAEMNPAQKAELDSWDTIEIVKEAALAAVVENFEFAIYLTVLAGESLQMTPTDLFNSYVAKNMLNRFRKSHGYKEGTYVKIWHGKEDNEHLTQILLNLDPADTEFETKVTDALTTIYSTVVN